MGLNILGLPKKTLSGLAATIRALKALRGAPDGFVGTGTDGYAEETQLGSGTPSNDNFLRGDGVWSAVSGAGLGDVTGDAVPTVDQNIVAYNGVGGKNIEELAGVQGDILYHNGTSWQRLAAGTNGYFLKTQGAAANPTWASGNSGDVTADDTSVTVQNIVAYNHAGGKNIVELEGTQGAILYHNGASWQKLNAGTDGQVLGTQGAGANPRWIPMVANGVYVDNVTDLEAAVNGASAGQVIYVAAGNYQLTGTLTLDVENVKVVGAGADVTYLRGLDYDTDIISIQAHGVWVTDLSIQHSTFAAGTGNGKGLAGSGRGIVFEMETTSSDNYGQHVIRNVNAVCTASWGIYDTGVYAMEDISYGDGFASAGTFSNTAEHPFPIWGYKTAIDSTTVVGIPVAADVSAVSTWAANSRTITSAGAFTNVRVGNYVYDVAGNIQHGTYVTAKASNSSITISKDTTALGTGVTLYFSRRTNCRVTVDNVIDGCNIAFTNSGGAMYLGYSCTTTTIRDLKTNNYSFGSFCAHNDTSPSAACTRGAVDCYGGTVINFYNPVFQSPSKQSGVVSTAHDDTDATMISIRLVSNIHLYASYFEVLSSNCEDGVDWRARGEDTYGYRQYWLITGDNSLDVYMDGAYFGCTTRKLDPAWLVSGTYYAGFPARLVRTLAEDGGFNFTMKGGRVGQWREFYSAIFGHATPPDPYAYGDFYPCPEMGTDTADPWDDDDFLFQGAADGAVTQPITIEDLLIQNYGTGQTREPTAPTGTAIFNRPCFRMHNNGRNLKLGVWTDISQFVGSTVSMDNASDRTALSQDFKGGMIGYIAGLGDGDGSIQREGLWGVSTVDHNWKQIPWIRKHTSIWSPVYAGDLWMKMASAVAGVFQYCDFQWYDGGKWRTGVGRVGTSSITARTTDLGATTLLTGTAYTAGVYRAVFYLKCTTAGDAGDTVTVTLSWNDGTAQTDATVILDAATLNNKVGGDVHFYSAASQNVTYIATVSSPGAGTPAYTVEARLEAVG